VALNDVSLTIHAGEIVAIAGVAGNGQEVLADLLSGLVLPTAGSVQFNQAPLPASPRAMVEAGIGRVPEDRHAVGVVGDLAIWETPRWKPTARRALPRMVCGVSRQRCNTLKES